MNDEEDRVVTETENKTQVRVSPNTLATYSEEALTLHSLKIKTEEDHSSPKHSGEDR